MESSAEKGEKLLSEDQVADLREGRELGLVPSRVWSVVMGHSGPLVVQDIRSKTIVASNMKRTCNTSAQ